MAMNAKLFGCIVILPGTVVTYMLKLVSEVAQESLLTVCSLSFYPGSDHLRQVFGKQMGLSDQDIVALSGGHTLVCCCPLTFSS
jgi:hypothetical protein